MTFIYLALALFCGVVALHSVAKFAAVTFGNKRWIGRNGAVLNYVLFAVFGTLSVWLITMALPGLVAG